MLFFNIFFLVVGVCALLRLGLSAVSVLPLEGFSLATVSE